MPAMTKKVNIQTTVAVRNINPPICGRYTGIIMSTSDILKCLCRRAQVDEVLPDGRLVRLNMSNYYLDNGAGLDAYHPRVPETKEHEKAKEPAKPPIDETKVNATLIMGNPDEGKKEETPAEEIKEETPAEAPTDPVSEAPAKDEESVVETTETAASDDKKEAAEPAEARESEASEPEKSAEDKIEEMLAGCKGESDHPTEAESEGKEPETTAGTTVADSSSKKNNKKHK